MKSENGVYDDSPGYAGRGGIKSRFHESAKEYTRIIMRIYGPHYTSNIIGPQNREEAIKGLTAKALKMEESCEPTIRCLLKGARAPETIKAYKTALGAFRKWQVDGPEERRKDELTSAAIFIAKRSAGVKATSLATFVSALAFERLGKKPEEASKWAVLDEMVRTQRKGDGERTRIFITKQEIDALLSALPRLSWPQWRKDRAHVLLILLFYGLLRISGAISLEGEDLTLGSSYWTVRIKKSKTDQDGQGCNVFIGREPTFDGAVARCQHRQVHGYLLASTDGRKWSSSAAASEGGEEPQMPSTMARM
ncbi:hypothetical protein ANCDUO_03288 [Ancylostoma duodenale]|uniref:Tyr recombinase domain-containing protein n=1 Tax=Ancylostoma duodenale TaxID=51022 RepID=A0A0C2D9G9_9BILA|nr:hypothetical protein ANCDUO_03288 [Ancylostoma duodenale]